jgi:hypothetical protein
MGRRRNANRVMVVKPEGRRPVVRARHRWKGIIKVDLNEMKWKNVDRIYVCQDWKPVAGCLKHGCKPFPSITCWKFLGQIFKKDCDPCTRLL